MTDTEALPETQPTGDAVARMKRLARMMSREMEIPHQKALDVLASIKGHTHWGSLAGSIAGAGDAEKLEHIVPQTGQAGMHPAGLFEIGRLGDYGIQGLADVLRQVDAGRGLLISGGTSTGKTDLMHRILQTTRAKARIGIVDFDEYVVGAPLARPNWSVTTYADFEDRKARIPSDYSRMEHREQDLMVLGEVSTITAMDMLHVETRMMTTVHCDTPEQAFDRIIRLATSGWSAEDIELRRERFMNHLSKRFCVIGMVRDDDGRRRIVTMEQATV